MPLGGLRGSTPLPSPLVPAAWASYDPITRRTVRFIEDIVPSVHMAPATDGAGLPADRFYCQLGLPISSAGYPFWCVATGTHQQWASPNAYLRNGAPGAAPKIVYYLGFGGESPDHAPKNYSGIVTVILQFRARFVDNTDYTVIGVGASSATSSFFATATDHFIQVTRNGAAWELGTCDGSTISQSSGGTADGGFHDFKIAWASGSIVLSVDGTSTITKSTNLPAEPLQVAFNFDAGKGVDIVDYLVRWE